VTNEKGHRLYEALACQRLDPERNQWYAERSQVREACLPALAVFLVR
jgi:hypothetical protein